MRFFEVFILYWSILDLQCCVSVPQSDSVTFTHIPVLFQILFLLRLFQNIE